MLDWSYSNLSQLYDIGYHAGEKFFEHSRQRLKTATPARDVAA